MLNKWSLSTLQVSLKCFASGLKVLVKWPKIAYQVVVGAYLVIIKCLSNDQKGLIKWFESVCQVI